MESPLLPITPAKKQAITPPVCLAATGVYTWLIVLFFYFLQTSGFRLETQLAKSTGEPKCHEARGKKSLSALLCKGDESNPELSLGVCMHFVRASCLKPFLGPWALAKPVSYPTSWHDAMVTDGQERRQQEKHVGASVLSAEGEAPDTVWSLSVLKLLLHS